jgi:hypothetical protein
MRKNSDLRTLSSPKWKSWDLRCNQRSLKSKLSFWPMMRWFNVAFLSYFPEFPHVDTGCPFKLLCNHCFGIFISFVSAPSQVSNRGHQKALQDPASKAFEARTGSQVAQVVQVTPVLCPRRDLYERTMRYYCEISVKTKSKNLSSIVVSNLAHEAMFQLSSTYSAAMCSDLSLWASKEIITTGDQQASQVWWIWHVGYGPDLGQRWGGWGSRLNLGCKMLLSSLRETKINIMDSPLIMFLLHFFQW